MFRTSHRQSNAPAFRHRALRAGRRRRWSAATVFLAALCLLHALWSPEVAAQKKGGGGAPADTGRIAFRRHFDHPASRQMVILDLASGQELLILPAGAHNSEGALAPAAWSHTGSLRWLVFRRMTGGVTDGVWAVREDGTGTHQVIPQATGEYDEPWHPTLSRDDQWLAFTAKAPGSSTYDVFIQAFDPPTATVTGPPVNLTQGTLRAYDTVVFGPSLPSSGQASIAFVADGAGGLRDIYRLDLAFGSTGPVVTAGPVNLTSTDNVDEVSSSSSPTSGFGLDWSAATPAWPQGRLVFRRTTRANSGKVKRDVVHMDPSPGAAPVLVVRDDTSTKLSWSPGADRILYDTTPPSMLWADLFAVSPDGSGKVNLTQTTDINEWFGTWRP